MTCHIGRLRKSFTYLRFDVPYKKLSCHRGTVRRYIYYTKNAKMCVVCVFKMEKGLFSDCALADDRR